MSRRGNSIITSNDDLVRTLAIRFAKFEHHALQNIATSLVSQEHTDLVQTYARASIRNICQGEASSIAQYIGKNRKVDGLKDQVFSQIAPVHKENFEKYYTHAKVKIAEDPSLARSSKGRRPASTSTYTPSAAAMPPRRGTSAPARPGRTSPTTEQKMATAIARSKRQVARSKIVLDASEAGLFNPFTAEDGKNFVEWQASMDMQDAAAAAAAGPATAQEAVHFQALDDEYDVALSHDEIDTAHDSLIKTKTWTNKSQGFFASNSVARKLGFTSTQNHGKINLRNQGDQRYDIIKAYNALFDLKESLEENVSISIADLVTDFSKVKVPFDAYKNFMESMEVLGYDPVNNFVEDIKEASKILKSRIKSQDFAAIREGDKKRTPPPRPPRPVGYGVPAAAAAAAATPPPSPGRGTPSPAPSEADGRAVSTPVVTKVAWV